MDVKRERLLNVYRHAPEIQDIRSIGSVPPSLVRLTHARMKRNSSDLAPVVSIDGEMVALVASRQMGALLVEVVRNTLGLSASACVRLVVDMCTHEAIAREWLECFGSLE